MSSTAATASSAASVDALGSVMDYLKSIRQDYVVLSDSDTGHQRCPWRTCCRSHIDTGADITAVCTAVPGDGQDTYFRLDARGRITDVAYGLHTPEGYRCLNIFVLRTGAADAAGDGVPEPQPCTASRRDILQGMKQPPASAKPMSTTATPPTSVPCRTTTDRSMELLDTGDPQRPVHARTRPASWPRRTTRPPATIDPEGGCVNSLVADGCDIQGSVKNCVLFRGVRIEKGASVENCILFKGTVVKRGCHPAGRDHRQIRHRQREAHPHGPRAAIPWRHRQGRPSHGSLRAER